MHVPTVRYHHAIRPKEKDRDPFVTWCMVVFALLSPIVWALAIAKLIDLFGP